MKVYRNDMMKPHTNHILAAILVLVCVVPIGGFAAVKKKTAVKPVRLSVERPELPAVESMTAPSGLKVFYIHDEIPQLVIRISAGFGKLYEEKSNAGVSELLARTLTLGGSKKYPGEALYRAVENVGGQLSIDSSWEETAVTIRVLSRYAELAFDIAEDLLVNPNFEEKYLNDARSLIKEGIRRKKDSPEALAFEKVREIIFNGSGYGASPTEASVDAVTIADLKNVWNTYFVTGNMMAGIVSSLDAAAVFKLAGDRFGSLMKGEQRPYTADAGKINAALRSSVKKIFLIPRPIPQATIVVGTVAPGIRDPRIYSLSVMNYILGEGSFNSRLMQEIRVKRGLSYAVQSVIKFRRDTGVFMAFAQTKNEQAPLALSLLLDNISKMGLKEVKPDELLWAKQSIINSYIFDFDTAIKVLAQYLAVTYNNLDPSYLIRFPERISAVKADAILKDSREMLKAGCVKVVVGDAALKKDLSRFGEVVVIQP